VEVRSNLVLENINQADVDECDAIAVRWTDSEESKRGIDTHNLLNPLPALKYSRRIGGRKEGWGKRQTKKPQTSNDKPQNHKLQTTKPQTTNLRPESSHVKPAFCVS
jgi:hypothetical protein